MKVVVISQKYSPRQATLRERLLKGGITNYEIVYAHEPHCWDEEYITSMNYGHEHWRRDPRLKNERKNAARMACYISHVDKVLWEAHQAGLEKILILEDDIVFKSNIMTKLTNQPEDALISFFDTTHIESIDGSCIVPYWEDFHKINVDKYRVWCAGCYLVNDVKKVYNLIIEQPPRVYDKLLIEIQKEHPCYLFMPPVCYQDREQFESTIK